MLMLSRRTNESVVFGSGDQGIAMITVVEIRGDKVRLGVEAHQALPVNRMELHRARLRAGEVRIPTQLIAAGRLASTNLMGSTSNALLIQCPDAQYLRAALAAGFVQFPPAVQQTGGLARLAS